MLDFIPAAVAYGVQLLSVLVAYIWLWRHGKRIKLQETALTYLQDQYLKVLVRKATTSPPRKKFKK